MGAKAFEEIWRPDGTVEKKAYIGDFAVVTETVYTSQTSSIQTDYLLRDHLGSLDVITDEAGTVVTRLSFDAWGKRREVNWTVMANPTLFQPIITTRGFTGHEQLDAVGLVHMNGRVYDAELGRFLSADPFIQDTENLQAWNRYSYVLNNPLSFTDPDGFFFKKIFKAIGKAFGKIFSFLKKNFKAILRIAITGIACANPAAPLTCAAVAVGTSFAFTLADGGSIGDALKAAAFAAVSVGTFTGVGTALQTIATLSKVGFAVVKSALHGVVGGALSVAQGGSFLQGFVSNAIGAATGLVSDAISQGNAFLDTVIVSVAGGIGAELTGGKFANGALFAAFGNIFNKWGTRGYDVDPFDETACDANCKEYFFDYLVTVSTIGIPSPTAIGYGIVRWLGAFGGRLGGLTTRLHVRAVARQLERRGYRIVRGGGRHPEEYLRGPNPGSTRGSSYPDITATKNGRTLRINTVDTRADGITPTTRELINAARIRTQRPGDHLLLVPKPK